MYSGSHQRGKRRLTIERSSATIPVQESPGIDQVKTIVIALHIHVDGVHKHSKDQGADYSKKDCALNIALHFTGNIRGELKADVLEEHYAGHTRHAYKCEASGVERIACLGSRIYNCPGRSTEKRHGKLHRVFVYGKSSDEVDYNRDDIENRETQHNLVESARFQDRNAGYHQQDDDSNNNFASVILEPVLGTCKGASGEGNTEQER